MTPEQSRREETLARLARDTFDLLVVGGGITGAGVALDAATRGLRVALVEKADFAHGTSSRSSRLIHGGLRYLAHLEIGLVREALRERGILQHLAPFLVVPTPFLIPRYERRLTSIRWGLEIYHVLAWGSGFPRHRRVGPAEARRLAPGLREDVAGGLLYWDARTDDARLTWTIVRTAIAHGATVVNHAEVTGLLRRGPGGRVVGARVTDAETGGQLEIRARAVVNATGIWSDEIRRLEDPKGELELRPSKGIHVILPLSLIPLTSALGIPAPDGRYVFVVPWEEEDRVLVGTTDAEYAGSLDDPRAEPSEIDYLLHVVNRVLARSLSASDVVATYAGLRPLLGKPGQSSKDLSRRHRVSVGDGGVVTITGGKLTTYRPMAADAVDAALESAGLDRRPSCITDAVPLAGGEEPPRLLENLRTHATKLGLPPQQATRLYSRYGANAAEILDLLVVDADLAQPLHPELPYLRAEAAYAIDREAARRPGDVLERRLRVSVTARDRGLAALDWVIDRLADTHGWTAERREREASAYRDAAKAARATEQSKPTRT